MIRRILLIVSLVLGVNLTIVAATTEGNQFLTAAIGGMLLGGFVTFMDPRGP